jgi:hypothetical protein
MNTFNLVFHRAASYKQTSATVAVASGFANARAFSAIVWQAARVVSRSSCAMRSAANSGCGIRIAASAFDKKRAFVVW